MYTRSSSPIIQGTSARQNHNVYLDGIGAVSSRLIIRERPPHIPFPERMAKELDVAERVGYTLGCFTHPVHKVRALTMKLAQRLETQRQESISPEGQNPILRKSLQGTSVVIKGAFEVEGLPFSAGGQLDDMLPRWFPGIRWSVGKKDAEVVAALRAHGMIPAFIGSHSPNSNDSTVYRGAYSADGTGRNPHDLSLTCGGSSGGVAAWIAVQNGDSDSKGGVGSSILGSGVLPAALCGIFGFNPTEKFEGKRVISQIGHWPRANIPGSEVEHLPTTSLMGSDVPLISAMFFATARPETLSLMAQNQAPVQRVAYLTENSWTLSSYAKEKMNCFSEKLKDEGFTVETISLRALGIDPDELMWSTGALFATQVAPNMPLPVRWMLAEQIKHHSHLPIYQGLLESANSIGLFGPSKETLAIKTSALAIRDAAREKWNSVVGPGKKYDVVLAPAAPDLPSPITHKSLAPINIDGTIRPSLVRTYWSMLHNMLGVPQVTVPLAPMYGAQILGGSMADIAILDFVAQLEEQGLICGSYRVSANDFNPEPPR